MIPRIAMGGASFKGAFQYYLHDKDASTRTRVAWTHTENIITSDPDKAWRVMAYTTKEQARLKEASGQKATGRKLTKPVFAYSLSWHPEQRPDRDHMLATARRSLETLGFTEHEAVIIAHRDEPQPHVHVIVNRVHPVTGIAGRTSNSKLRLSDFAREYEIGDGKIYCQQRQENHRKRQQGEKAMYRDPVIVEAWEHSDNGRGFVNALTAKGYQLARGRSRLVVIDPYGQAHNPVRHLENIRTKDFNKRLEDFDLTRLPDAGEVSKAVLEKNRQRYDASRRHDEQTARQRNRLQERHLTERAEVANGFESRLSREREQLEQQYGLRKQATEINQLREQTKNPRWWQRWFGFTRRAQKKLEGIELSYKNANWRVQERVGQLESERDKALTRLQERQTQETRRTEERLQFERPNEYVNGAERDKMREAFEASRPPHSPRGLDLERE